MSSASVQPDSARETVQKLFAALGGGDIDGVINLLDPEVTWFVPGDRALVPWVGTWRGHEEMREFFTIIAKVAEPRAFELFKIFDDENDVVVLGRFAYFYPSSGQVFDDQFAMHFTVIDGKITSYRIHEDSYALANAFTGR
jgi:ketosteroid isomerase-like protein